MGAVPELATPLIEAMRAAGLPERAKDGFAKRQSREAKADIFRTSQFVR
jgi:hypothetical protein